MKSTTNIEGKKKTDSLAIASFVLILTTIFIELLFRIAPLFYSGEGPQSNILGTTVYLFGAIFLIAIWLLPILSIIFAIASLYKNKNKSLKEKLYAILGIIIALLYILLSGRFFGLGII